MVYNKNMRFEDKIITFKPKPLREDPYTMERLGIKRESYFEQHRPEIDNFPDVDKEERDEDKKEIARLKELWEEDDENEKFQKEVSSIFEGAIFDLIEANEFLGEGCEIVPASEWDDIKNGVDGVFVFEREKEEEEDFYSGVEIDVTFSSKDSVIEKKIKSIKSCIKGGVLPTLKYFKDPKTGEHKTIPLPKVMIGVQQSSAEGLIRLWGSSNDNKDEKLKNHPVQSKIILELLIQLEYFLNFSKDLRNDTEDPNKWEQYNKICKKYGLMYNRIYEVYTNKKDLIVSHMNEISSDVVYNKILEITGAKDK